MAKGSKTISGILIVAVLGLAGYLYIEKKDDTQKVTAQFIEHTVALGDMTIKVVADGSAVAKLTRVRTLVGGEVSRVHVMPGQQVTAGQLLMEIRDADFRIKVNDAEEKLMDAKGKLEKAKQEHETKLEDERTKVETQKSAFDAVALEYHAMLEVSEAYSEIYSKHEIELKRIAYESAKQSYDAAMRAYQAQQDTPSYAGAEQLAVTQAEVALANAREELTQTKVVAPVGGQVAQILLAEGSYAGVNAEAVFIAAPGPLTAAGQVFELDLAGIDVGMPVEVAFEALGGQKFEGVVMAIDALPAGQSDRMMMERYPMGGNNPVNYTVTVQLNEENPTIRSGMSCQIHFTKERVDGVLILPRSAVRRAEDKHYIKVKSANGSVEEKEIVLGRVSGKDVEVVSGLTEGERVLVPAELR